MASLTNEEELFAAYGSALDELAVQAAETESAIISVANAQKTFQTAQKEAGTNGGTASSASVRRVESAKAEAIVAVRNHKEAEAKWTASIKTVARANAVEEIEVVNNLAKYIDARESQRIMTILKASQTMDLCFVIDGTGSMGPSMTGVKETIRGIVGEIQEGMKYAQIRLAAIIYRDVCDGSNRFAVHPFSGSISAFIAFCESQHPMGGGDQCEDTIGGLDKVTELDWRFQNRVLMLIADAPCHGREYHDGCNDNYPSGSFPGAKDAFQVMQRLKELRIDMTFFKLNNYTDRMIEKLDDLAGGNFITTANLNPSGLMRGDFSDPNEAGEANSVFIETIKSSIIESVKSSISRSTSASASAAKSVKKRDCSHSMKRMAKLSTVQEEGAAPGSSGGAAADSSGGSQVARPLPEIVKDIKASMGIDNKNMAEAMAKAMSDLQLEDKGTLKLNAQAAAEELGIPTCI